MGLRRKTIALMIVAAGLMLLPDRARCQDTDLVSLQKKILANTEKIRACTVGVGNGGSGVLVSEDGYILTCAHVAQKSGRKVKIWFPDGRAATATTLGNHHDADAGLIKLDEPGDYPFAKMGSSEKLAVGDWVLAVGYPVSFSKRQSPPVRLGRLTRKFRTQLRTDAPIMGGDSGGPLFNLDGEVIGINSKVSGSIKNNIHVAIGEYTKNWDRLVASEEWGRRYDAAKGQNRESRPQRPPLGGKQPPSTEPKKSTPNTPPKPAGDAIARVKALGITKLQDTPVGPQIQGVIIDSLAWKSSIRAGQVISKVGGRSVKSAADVAAEIGAAKSNTVEIVVGRQDQDHSQVTLDLRLKE